MTRPRLGKRIARGLGDIVSQAENAFSCSIDGDGKPDGDWSGCDPDAVRAAFAYLNDLIAWSKCEKAAVTS